MEELNKGKNSPSSCIRRLNTSYLGNIVGSVPEHCNRMNITVEQITHYLDSQWILKLDLHPSLLST